MSDDELVTACAQSTEAEAWLEFRGRFHRLIACTVIKACLEWSQRSPEVIDDLIQETYLKLCDDNCALLAEFVPHHLKAFRGYLKKITANVVYDHFRAEHAIKRNVDNTVELNEAIDQLRPGSGDLEPMELAVLVKEIDDVLRSRGTGPDEEKERTIFWLYYRHGFTAKAISEIPAMELSVEGVESVIHRLKTFVRKSLVMTSAQ